MNVIVVGAGIIGVTTAWYLRQHGVNVAVVEQRAGVAQEASFGNAGVIAPGYVTPWAAPGMPRKVLSYLFSAEAPVLFRPSLTPALWRWALRWLGECRLDRYRVNKSRMQRVAFYSRDQLHALRDRLSIQYEQSQGYLQLLRSERDIALTAPARDLLDESAVPYRMLEPGECYELEPGLSQNAPLAGAILLPEDEAGNGPLFAQALRRAAEDAGVRFRFNTPVDGLIVEGDRVTGIATRGHRYYADAVVVSAAVCSVPLLASCFIRLPLYPDAAYPATVRPDPLPI